jgi:hypothetical protein
VPPDHQAYESWERKLSEFFATQELTLLQPRHQHAKDVARQRKAFTDGLAFDRRCIGGRARALEDPVLHRGIGH